ncbi:PucR family transcriptional regulator [Tomitella fengzijianii]|uniref:PucR family transcriptional regulator n=1 Tax=Tomitella fengzijianii TaxID=2597660 RepID=A0A516X4L9_9ACTN|nr:helix-turn-helix domain-containing protein [Tomitella fengzijianii]QDQ98006.1 PucR family transcriptional regulator [Tomitella fengzijianii]
MTRTAMDRGRTMMLNGRPASHTLADTTALAEEVLRHHAATSTDYRLYRMADVHTEIVRSVAAGFRLAARLLDGGPLPTEDELSGILTLIAEKALVGVPLSAMMSLTDETVGKLRATVLAPADARDNEDLREINDRIFAFAQHIHTTIPICYINAARRPEGPGTAPSLAEALLAGRAPSGDVPRGYLVVRLVVDPWSAAPSAVPRGTDPARISVGPGALPPHLAIKAGHDLGEACRQLSATFPGTLIAPEPHHGLLLAQAPVDALRAALREIGTVLGTEISAVTDTVATAQIPRAVEDTRELARIITRLRYPAGVYTFSDLAVEYQLTRPGPGRDRLAAALDPLAANAGLIETLGVHIGNDLDRRRTATALGLHPNTVDHRLKRIAKLTGHDPTRARGLRHLHAATVVGRFLQAPMPRTAHLEQAAGSRLSSR